MWGSLIALMAAYALYHIVQYVGTEVTLAEVGHVFVLGLITLLRVAGLILIASLIWVPLGVMIGLRPSLAEKSSPSRSSSRRSRRTCCSRCSSL